MCEHLIETVFVIGRYAKRHKIRFSLKQYEQICEFLIVLHVLRGSAPSNAKCALLVKSQTDRKMAATSARVKPTHLKEMSLAGHVSFQL